MLEIAGNGNDNDDEYDDGKESNNKAVSQLIWLYFGDSAGRRKLTTCSYCMKVQIIPFIMQNKYWERNTETLSLTL